MSGALPSITGGSGVKSIQRGTILLTGGADATKTATVSSVTTAKSELRILGTTSNAFDGSNNIRIELTNATTITATRITTTSSASVSWELTEFY